MNALERIQRQIQALPPEKQKQVGEFVAYLSTHDRQPATQGRSSIMRHAGALEGSPNLNEDPIEIQRNLRDEW